ISAEPGYQVPGAERAGSVCQALHRAREEEELRHEHDVDADKQQPEMNFAEKIGIAISGNLWKQVVPDSEEGEHHGQPEHVMPMRRNEVGVVKDAVAGIGH